MVRRGTPATSKGITNSKDEMWGLSFSIMTSLITWQPGVAGFASPELVTAKNQKSNSLSAKQGRRRGHFFPILRNHFRHHSLTNSAKQLSSVANFIQTKRSCTDLYLNFATCRRKKLFLSRLLTNRCTNLRTTTFLSSLAKIAAVILKRKVHLSLTHTERLFLSLSLYMLER